MELYFREWVYDSAMGNMANGYELNGVENLFAEGKECHYLYAEILEAYERLCGRLGVVDEDKDIEVILNNFLRICRIAGLEMYNHGARLGITE